MNKDKNSGVIPRVWRVIVKALSRKKKEENKIETPKENKIKIEKKAIVILTFLSIVIIVIVIAVLRYIITTVPVPNVVGMTLQKAKDSITGNNLFEVSVEPSDADDNWKVTGQNPQGGRVRRGATIELWAKPPEKIEHPKPEKPEVPPLEGKSEKEAKSIPPIETQVPNVIGMTLEDAKGTITANKLQVGRIEKKDSDRPQNTVIHQDPPPRTFQKPGTKVYLTIAKWRTLPNVIEMTLEQAKKEILDDFFEINIRPPDARDDWKVAKQTPEENREYPKGTKITIEMTPPPSDGDLDKLYIDALEKMRQHRYQEAIKGFEEILRLGRNGVDISNYYTSTSWNLIICYDITGNYSRAIETLNRSNLVQNVYFWYYKGAAHYKMVEREVLQESYLSQVQIRRLIQECNEIIETLGNAWALSEDFGTRIFDDVDLPNNKEGYIENTRNYLRRARELQDRLSRLRN